MNATALLDKLNLSGLQSTGQGPLRLILFSQDPALVRESLALQENLAEEGGLIVEVYEEALAEANKRAAGKGLGSADIVILDAGKALEASEQISTLCYHLNGDAELVVLGEENSVSVYREICSLGVLDYLPKPVAQEDLIPVLERAATVKASAKTAGTDSSTPGAATSTAATQVTPILGVRSGVGASTLTNNLAWLLAETAEKEVLLVDCDLHFSAVPIAFDIEPTDKFAEALRHPDRLDHFFIKSACQKVGEHLSIIGLEEPLPDGISNPLVMAEDNLGQIIAESQGHFGHVLVDLPRNAFAAQDYMFKRCQSVVLVSDLSLIGIRDTLRLVSHIEILNPSCKPVIVLSKVRGKGDQLSVQDFEKAVGCQVACTIAADETLFVEALNTGVLAVKSSPKAEACQNITAVMYHLTGEGKPIEVTSSSLPPWLDRGLKWLLD